MPAGVHSKRFPILVEKPLAAETSAAPAGCATAFLTAAGRSLPQHRRLPAMDPGTRMHDDAHAAVPDGPRAPPIMRK
jgi:hypothetical protein